jgi:hypothetical protein
MSVSSRAPRSTPQLSESFLRNVNAYTLAAGAAGVSILALAQSAGAEIVYNPIHGVLAGDHTLTLDLNHDGIPDFQFHLRNFAYHTFYATLSVTPLGSNGVIAGGGYAYPIVQGGNIGLGGLFVGGGPVRMERTEGSFYIHSFRNFFGPWVSTKNGYVGVEFLIDGATHYGWIRMSVSGKYIPMGVEITGYAYETVAGQTILAGQTEEKTKARAEALPMAHASLGMLALGSRGLELWRREDSSLSMQ